MAVTSRRTLRAPGGAGAREAELLTTLPGAILWEADPETFLITFVNSSAVGVLGYPTEQWLEPGFWLEHVHQEDRPTILRGCRELVEGGQDLELEYRMLAADGRAVWIRDHVLVVRDADGRARTLRGLMTDISEHKRVQQRLLAQYTVSKILAESYSIEEAAPKVLQRVCESLDWDVAEIWVIDAAARALILRDIWHAPTLDAGGFVAASRAKTFLLGEGLPGRIWASGEPCWIADLATDNNFPRAPYAKEVGLTSGCGFPIRLGEETLGVMGFFSRERRQSDDALLEAFASLGRQVGQFVAHRRFEQELRESETRFHKAFQASPAAISITRGRDRVFLDANDTFCETTGYAREELVGKAVDAFDIWSSAEEADRFRRAIAEEGSIRQAEFLLRTCTGEIRDTIGSAEVIDLSGEPCVLALFYDITERKRIEEQLRGSEERLRVALDAGKLGTWEWDIQTGEVAWSESLELIHGIPPASFAGTFEAFLQDVHPEDCDRLVHQIQESVAAGTHDVEYRIIRPDGETRWVAGTGRVVCDHAGMPLRMAGVCQDITERKHAEEALRDAVARTTAILETAVDGIITIDDHGHIESVNSAVGRLFGYEPEELAGRNVNMLMPSPYQEEHGGYLSHYLATGERKIIGIGRRVEGRRKDGSVFPMHLSVSELTLGDRRFFTGIVHDITDTMRSEERLHLLAEAAALFAASLDFDTVLARIAELLVGTMADWCAIDLIDDEGVVTRPLVTHADPSKAEIAERLKQFAPDPEAARSVAAVLRGGTSILEPQLSDSHLTDAAVDEEHLRIMRDLGFKSAMVVPLLTRDRLLGAITFVSAESGHRYTVEDLSLAEDIALRAALAIDNARLYREAQNVQEQLRTANEAKDEFLGLVSHELRTPITTIYGGARVLRSRRDQLSEENRLEILEDIEHETERLYRLVEDLLVLARLELGQEIELEPVLIQRVVEKIAKSVEQRMVGHRLELELAEAGPVLGDATYLEQVLRNLVSNAEKYSPAGTPITVCARPAGDEAIVTVLDRGPGISDDETESIFERFYRSRAAAGRTRGLGLGLTVCKRLIEAQGGRIWAQARDGGGLEIGFAIPLYREEASWAPNH